MQDRLGLREHFFFGGPGGFEMAETVIAILQEGATQSWVGAVARRVMVFLDVVVLGRGYVW